MDLREDTPHLTPALLGAEGEAHQEAAWTAVIERMVDRAFGTWRIMGANGLGTMSGPGNHSVEVVS
jgi:hypothetical protein